MILGRPGPFGDRKEDIINGYNSVYGNGNWSLVWKIGDKYFSLSDALMLYEDAYFEFFKENPERLEYLVENASDVYDIDEGDVFSKTDYGTQMSKGNHFQDIAIRRCLIRFGKWFRGKSLIRVRGNEYSPGKIKFHRLYLIEQPELKGWWDHGSIESFYQSNKFLEVKYDTRPKADVYFVTSNNGKFQSAKLILNEHGIDCVQIKLDMSEPYSDVKKNVEWKAKVARSVLLHPVICDDSGLIIPSMDNYPGGHVHRELRKLGLVHFLENVNAPVSCYFYQVLAYAKPESEIFYFENKVHGKLISEPKGKLKPWHKSELMLAFIPDGSDKTVAEMSKEEYLQIASSDRWQKLSEFLKNDL